MTKSQFQQELKEKVKPGLKPSHLRKLKRSKSADDIPSAPPAPVTQIKNLEDQVSVLELKLETKNRELTEKDTNLTIYSDQLQEKQKEIESLRKKLEQAHHKLTETTNQLDNSLLARYEAVKQFSKIHDQLQKVKQELDENVDQASSKLISQDKKISQYRTNQQNAQRKIQELERDLNLTQRLVKLKEFSFPSPEADLSYLKYTLYSLVAVVFTIWLTNNLRKKEIK